MAFLLLVRTDSLTLGIVWRTVRSLGTKHSFPPVVVTIMAEKPPVVNAELTVGTVGSTVATIESLSTEVLRSWLQLVAML